MTSGSGRTGGARGKTRDEGHGGEPANRRGRVRDVRDEAAVAGFIETFAGVFVEAGVGRMPARVFAALLAADSGAMTSAELGERLQVSPAAVSGAVRYLSQQHMLSIEREPGTRRDRYRVRDDQWYEALASRDVVIKRWQDSLRDGVRSLGPDTPAGRRMGETLAFFEFVGEELPLMLERWRVRREELFGDD